MAGIVEKLKSGATIIDVRTAEEFEDEHYPNAVNIPVDQVQFRVDEFGDKNAAIIVYCATGSRSAYAARILKSVGFKDVINAGGLYDMPEVQ